MNGHIIYCGVSESIECRGTDLQYRDGVFKMCIDRVWVPHMLHLLRMQGLSIASIFSGEFRCDDEKIDLSDWMLAKCSYSKLWEVPYYLWDVVLVKGQDRKQTMLACVQVHERT